MTISDNVYQHLTTSDNILFYLIDFSSEEFEVQRKGNVDNNFNFSLG